MATVVKLECKWVIRPKTTRQGVFLGYTAVARRSDGVELQCGPRLPTPDDVRAWIGREYDGGRAFPTPLTDGSQWIVD